MIHIIASYFHESNLPESLLGVHVTYSIYYSTLIWPFDFEVPNSIISAS